jgi:hypothetical protein
MKLTKAEVQHIRAALGEYRYLITQYPEIVTNDQDDQLKIAQEIVREDSDT